MTRVELTKEAFPYSNTETRTDPDILSVCRESVTSKLAFQLKLGPFDSPLTSQNKAGPLL